MQIQLLALPGFAEIAHRKFLHTVALMEGAGQQVVDPVQIPGVIHVAVAVQVRKAHAALSAAVQVLGHERGLLSRLFGEEGDCRVEKGTGHDFGGREPGY